MCIACREWHTWLKMLKARVRKTVCVTIRYLKESGSSLKGETKVTLLQRRQDKSGFVLHSGQNSWWSKHSGNRQSLTSSSLNVVSCFNRLNLPKRPERG